MHQDLQLIFNGFFFKGMIFGWKLSFSVLCDIFYFFMINLLKDEAIKLES